MIHAKKDYKGEAFNVLHDTMQITVYKGSRNDPCKSTPSICNRMLQQKASQEAFDCIPTLGKWRGAPFEIYRIIKNISSETSNFFSLFDLYPRMTRALCSPIPVPMPAKPPLSLFFEMNPPPSIINVP